MPDATHMKELYNIRAGFAADSIPTARLSDYVVQALIGRGEFWHSHYAAFQYRHDESLAKVTQPALILTNTGDPIYSLALTAHAIRPDFAFLALYGGGVDIVDQQPEVWSDAAAGFLHGLATQTGTVPAS